MWFHPSQNTQRFWGWNERAFHPGIGRPHSFFSIAHQKTSWIARVDCQFTQWFSSCDFFHPKAIGLNLGHHIFWDKAIREMFGHLALIGWMEHDKEPSDPNYLLLGLPWLLAKPYSCGLCSSSLSLRQANHAAKPKTLMVNLNHINKQVSSIELTTLHFPACFCQLRGMRLSEGLLSSWLIERACGMGDCPLALDSSVWKTSVKGWTHPKPMRTWWIYSLILHVENVFVFLVHVESEICVWQVLSWDQFCK